MGFEAIAPLIGGALSGIGQSIGFGDQSQVKPFNIDIDRLLADSLNATTKQLNSRIDRANTPVDLGDPGAGLGNLPVFSGGGLPSPLGLMNANIPGSDRPGDPGPPGRPGAPGPRGGGIPGFLPDDGVTTGGGVPSLPGPQGPSDPPSNDPNTPQEGPQDRLPTGDPVPDPVRPDTGVDASVPQDACAAQGGVQISDSSGNYVGCSFTPSSIVQPATAPQSQAPGVRPPGIGQPGSQPPSLSSQVAQSLGGGNIFGGQDGLDQAQAAIDLLTSSVLQGKNRNARA